MPSHVVTQKQGPPKPNNPDLHLEESPATTFYVAQVGKLGAVTSFAKWMLAVHKAAAPALHC